MEAGERLLYFIRENNQSEYEAWNNTSVFLVHAAKVKLQIIKNPFFFYYHFIYLSFI